MVEARVPRSALAAFQAVEYLRAFLFGRLGWDSLNSLMIVSGAFGLFRRDVLLEAGGYWADTVGEDLELTIRLHRHLRDRGGEYRIAYAPDPICWTEVPEAAATLGRQRRRWHRGLWESLWRHRGMFCRPRYGAPGMVALPYLLLFEFGGPLIEALAWVMFPIGLAYGMVDPRLVGAFPGRDRLSPLSATARAGQAARAGGVRKPRLSPADRRLPAGRGVGSAAPAPVVGEDAAARLRHGLVL